MTDTDTIPPTHAVAMETLNERLAEMAAADSADHEAFDELHDRVAAAMADERDARSTEWSN